MKVKFGLQQSDVMVISTIILQYKIKLIKPILNKKIQYYQPNRVNRPKMILSLKILLTKQTQVQALCNDPKIVSHIQVAENSQLFDIDSEDINIQAKLAVELEEENKLLKNEINIQKQKNLDLLSKLDEQKLSQQLSESQQVLIEESKNPQDLFDKNNAQIEENQESNKSASSLSFKVEVKDFNSEEKSIIENISNLASQNTQFTNQNLCQQNEPVSFENREIQYQNQENSKESNESQDKLSFLQNLGEVLNKYLHVDQIESDNSSQLVDFNEESQEQQEWLLLRSSVIRQAEYNVCDVVKLPEQQKKQ
ncbi:UNKNOWN [Stylonychia lemnae]|uniref:Uncharacterized protein n=1 Tax=Stylonychia lemnae TaxID=5949 RepID=A0A078A3X3_STYLE|nr:UNKNOWN [Stylonychia lemnae]|eukprot:CDW76223.1 UNKNOWN [Stylonychia lemnae]